MAGFVDVLVGEADVGDGWCIFASGSYTAKITALANLAPLLRRVVFVGDPPFLSKIGTIERFRLTLNDRIFYIPKVYIPQMRVFPCGTATPE